MNKKLQFLIIITLIGFAPLRAETYAPAEYISVATDRDAYIAGDWVYFSILVHNNGNHISDYVYVTLNSEDQKQIFTGCLEIKNNIASGSFFLSDTLNTGIYQFVSYTNQLRNYEPAAFATKNIIIANRFDIDLKKITSKIVSKSSDSLNNITNPSKSDSVIILDKKIYQQRELAVLQMRFSKEIPTTLLSVAIRKVAPVTFDINKSRIVSTPTGNGCKFLPEQGGIILQGIVKDPVNPTAKKIVYLSCEDSIANLQYTETSGNGDFIFFLNPYYFGKKIFVKLEGEDKSPIEIKSKYYSGIIGDLPVQVHGDLEGYLKTDQKYLSIQRSYKEMYRVEPGEMPAHTGWRPEVYSKKGVEVRPADYNYLPNFRDISHELLTYYKIRVKKEELSGVLIDINQNEFATPYIFLNGILLEHVRQIMPLNSKKVKTIVTIPNARYVGNLLLPGVLDVRSVSNSEIDKIQWRYAIAKYNIEKPMPFSTYKLENLSNIPRYIPAYMPLLYWNPSLQINSGETRTVSFYTSDCTGAFEVVVKGFTSEGNEIEFRKVFEVNSK